MVNESLVKDQLYNFVRVSQIVSHSKSRYLGAWPVEVTSPQFSHEETDSFLPLITLLILDEVSRYMVLPRHQEVIENVEESIIHYLDDAIETREPEGTIGHWPVWELSDGRKARTLDPAPPFNKWNLPNDLDNSAMAANWFLAAGVRNEFVTNFVHRAGDYRDTQRTAQAIPDDRWKSVNSGGFLTWAEPENVSGSRITWGSNDVDCIVNLNVLAALGRYAKNRGEVPEKTRDGMESACQLIHLALLQNKTNACAVYYERVSQFLIAYARANQFGISCLESSNGLAKELAVREAQVILNRNEKNFTEIAEVIISLKQLFQPSERESSGLDVDLVIEELTQSLIGGVTSQGDVAYVPSKDSLFTSGVSTDRIWWSSQAFSSALALQSLALP